MSSSLIRGRYLICSHEQVIPGGALYQEDGRIVAVGPYEALRDRYRPDQELGSEEFVVMPGLVDSHYHGRGITPIQLGVLDEPLETTTLHIRAALQADPYLDTMIIAMRMLQSGITTVFHSATVRQTVGYESVVREGIRAFVDLGMRVVGALGIRTQNSFVYQDDELFLRSLPPEMRERMGRLDFMPSAFTLDRCLAAFDALRDEFGDSSQVRIVLAPTSPQWCAPEVLRALKRKADESGSGLQMHLLETAYQRAYGWRAHGKSLAAYLRDLEVLGPNVSVAHSVWASESDLDILAETGTSVAHNPSCNLRLKSGIAPVVEMLDRGINVGLGTDSATLNDDEDMIQEMRLCAKLHRQPGIGKRSVTSREVLKMATANGAAITHFPDTIGVLEPGRQADVVLLRLQRLAEPYLDPGIDIVDLVLYRAKSQDVDTVIVGGEPILKGGKPVRVDGAEINSRLKEQMAHLPPATLARLAEKRQLVRDLMPYVTSFYDGWLSDQPEPYYLFNSRR